MKNIIKDRFLFMLLSFILVDSAVAAIELPLKYTAISQTSQVGGGWDTWYFAPTGGPAGQFNYVGLKGNITMSYDGNNDATVLFQIFLDRNGQCPQSGRYYHPELAPPWSYFYRLPNGTILASYILRTSKPGIVTIPTEFILPAKVPFSGCIGILINGGELNYGDPVTTTSNIILLYDRDAPPIPATKINTFASEICIGREWGCEKLAPYSTSDQAFARYQRFNSRQILLSWFGNINSASSRAGDKTLQCAPGVWDSDSDYYIYKAADCPTTAANQIIYSGPTVDAARIPASAIWLYSAIVHGSQCEGGQSLISKTFDPPLTVLPGDCMVQVQRFDTPSGIVAEETQSTFVTQGGTVGYLDSAGCSNFAGWAGNMGDQAPIDIHFYADGGHFIGRTTANRTREKAVCDALKITESSCDHGFLFSTPSSLKDDSMHTIAAYAINGGDNPELIGSGLNIFCAAALPEQGDLNNDGKVDIFDLRLLISDLGKSVGFNADADLNKDSKVNLKDIVMLAKTMVKA